MARVAVLFEFSTLNGGERSLLALADRICVAASFADTDNDGDADAFVVVNGGAAQLLRNDAPAGNHWLKVRVQGEADLDERFRRMAGSRPGPLRRYPSAAGHDRPHSLRRCR